METETVLCRLCMTSGSKHNLIDMTKDLCKKALLCVSIKVNLKSKPEAMLCKICCDQLKNFYDFKKKCIENNVKYNVLYAQCKHGTIKKLELVSDDTFMPIGNIFGIREEENKVNSKIKNELEKDYIEEEEGPETRYLDDNSDDFESPVKEETHCLKPNPAETERSALPKVRDKADKINKIFQCEECGRTFKDKSVLKQHIVSHMGLKLYSCDICSKKFTRAEHKHVHMRAHNGIKPYICEICGKTSSKRQDLLRHKLIHSEEKKYECKECGKKFKTSYGVRSHMKSHSENRKYSCKRCDKSYKSHSSLQKHLKSHVKKDAKNKTNF